MCGVPWADAVIAYVTLANVVALYPAVAGVVLTMLGAYVTVYPETVADGHSRRRILWAFGLLCATLLAATVGNQILLDRKERDRDRAQQERDRRAAVERVEDRKTFDALLLAVRRQNPGSPRSRAAALSAEMMRLVRLEAQHKPRDDWDVPFEKRVERGQWHSARFRAKCNKLVLKAKVLARELDIPLWTRTPHDRLDHMCTNPLGVEDAARSLAAISTTLSVR